MRILSRDPFARHDVVRVTVPQYDRMPCSWCGNRPGRFTYGIDRDTLHNRLVMNTGAFCCKSCHDSYHTL